jgi:SAM-dependent methyltransferase
MESSLYSEMFETEENFWWFRAKREIILTLLKRYGPPGGRPSLLDLGCGCGYSVQYFSTHFETTGMDSSDDALAFCRKRGLSVLKGSLPGDLPVEGESFDAVVLSDVLEHVDEDARSVEAVAGVLRPGGLMIATVPAHRFMWTRRDDYHHHKRRYEKAEFEKLFDIPCLEKVLLSYYNTFLFPPMLLSRVMSKILGTDREGPDINQPPAFVNHLLERVFALERHFLGRVPLPAGASLVALYRKKGQEPPAAPPG